MKESGKAAVSFWRNGIILMSIGTMTIFTCLLTMDIETFFTWANLSTRETTERITGFTNPNITKPHAHHMKTIPHDDPDCLARTQHLLYRRDPERFTPSPAFTKAWHRYALMHKACTHKKNLTHTFLYSQDDCRYLVVMEGNGGMGNKFLSLTSAVAYALATDRVVLVEGGNRFQNLLCDPFPGSSWFLPRDFPYENLTATLEDAIARNFTDVASVSLHLDHIQSRGDTQFFCDRTQFGLRDVRWVSWSSTQYFVTRLFMMASLWERLDGIFPGGEVFTVLSHRVLLPRNELWARVVRVFLGYLADATRRVGTQVRLHGRSDLAEYEPLAFERIVACLQSRKVLPELTSMEDVSDMMVFARNGWEGSSTEIAVLVASLQLKYYDELKDLYAGKPNVNNTVIRFHMVSHLGRQDSTVHQGESAFMEMWLLSFSDVLAISPYSTFGYVAQGLGGVRATLYLNIKGELQGGPNATACFDGRASAQPCTHFPQHPKCEGGPVNEAHRAWMRRHVRECVDHPGGLQLVGEAEQPNLVGEFWEH